MAAQRDSSGRFVSSGGGLSTSAAYRAWAKRRNEALKLRMAQAMAISMDVAGQLARSEEYTGGTYDDQTGNLRHSSGTLEFIATPNPPRSLSIPQPSPDARVHLLPGKIVGVNGIGMEYAPHVAEGGPWPENIVPAVKQEIREQFTAALKLAAAEVGAAA